MLVTFTDEGSPARSSCTILRCLSRAAALLSPNRILPQRISTGELHSVFRFKVLMNNRGNNYVPRDTKLKRDSYTLLQNVLQLMILILLEIFFLIKENKHNNYKLITD